MLASGILRLVNLFMECSCMASLTLVVMVIQRLYDYSIDYQSKDSCAHEMVI